MLNKTVILKDTSKDRLISKFQALKRLAVKKGTKNTFYTNYLQTIFMFSPAHGIEITIFINQNSDDKLRIADVNYKNKTYFIQLGVEIV